MTDDELIYVIQSWAKEHNHFDTTFVDKMEKKLGEFGYLTEGQQSALNNIIKRYRIPH